MRCTKCGFENPIAAKFCEECGAKLTCVCPRCGHESSPTAKYCSECGASLSATPLAESAAPVHYTPPHLAERILAEQATLEARGESAGERKTITAL
ncbi:MAG: zinc-ribbon domain-containing protein, partial [Pseudomonadales bacterium]